MGTKLILHVLTLGVSPIFCTCVPFFLQLSIEHEYMENNCAEDPISECQFKPIKGLILKTVDSVYQKVANVDICKQLCVNADFR